MVFAESGADRHTEVTFASESTSLYVAGRLKKRRRTFDIFASVSNKLPLAQAYEFMLLACDWQAIAWFLHSVHAYRFLLLAHAC